MGTGQDQVVARSTGSTAISIVDLETGDVVDEVDLGGPEPVGWIMARPPDGHELILVAHPAPGAPDFALYGYDLDTGGVRHEGGRLGG